ncbi:hypothetical protein [Spirobacillus cienkowskii]|uniref:hypothetical protein n=1 Tax=Spirobacillus cienkowskii TaxID=495820 RepID=UPI0030CE4350
MKNRIFLTSFVFLTFSETCFASKMEPIKVKIDISGNTCDNKNIVNVFPLENQDSIIASGNGQEIKIKDLKINEIQELYEIEKKYYDDMSNFVTKFNFKSSKNLVINFSEPKPPRVSFNIKDTFLYGSDNPKIKIVYIHSLTDRNKGKAFFDKVMTLHENHANDIKFESYLFDGLDNYSKERAYFCAYQQGKQFGLRFLKDFYNDELPNKKYNYTKKLEISAKKFNDCYHSQNTMFEVKTMIKNIKDLGFGESFVIINGLIVKNYNNILDITNSELSNSNYLNNKSVSQYSENISPFMIVSQNQGADDEESDATEENL